MFPKVALFSLDPGSNLWYAEAGSRSTERFAAFMVMRLLSKIPASFFCTGRETGHTLFNHIGVRRRLPKM